jgi:hypothetical protein
MFDLCTFLFACLLLPLVGRLHAREGRAIRRARGEQLTLFPLFPRQSG